MERDHFDQSDRLNERKVTLKRRYTENHPAITAGAAARIRNKMLEAIADGKITQDEFNSMLSELSANSKRWMKRNSQYFNVSEDGVTLSKSGSRILNQIKTEKPTMRKLVMESFNEFVNRNSTEMINEGTRGQFGKIYKNGEIRSVYTHYDSYPDHMLPIIKKAYKKGNVDDIISKGDNSGLEASVDKMNFYGVPDAMNPMKGKKSKIDSYIKQAANDSGAEFIYLYDESDKNWYMVDVYGDRELVPAFESVETEGEELNEAYVKSAGYKAAQERIEGLAAQLDPNSRLCKGISKAADNVTAEFREMKKHMDEIYSIWQDVEYTIGMSNESAVTEDNEKLFEAEVEMDAMDPDNKDFLKFLKKNRVKIIAKTMEGPAGGHPVITMQGKKKDLENVLADCEYGWCDEELAEYIEESLVTEAFKSSKLRNLVNMAQSGEDRYGKKSDQLAAAIYGISKIKLDEVEDADLVDVTPKVAYKDASKDTNAIVFYIIDNEKENTYADSKHWSEPTLRPGILAVSRGKDFLGVSYNQRDSRGGRDKRGMKAAYGLSTGASPVGGNKNYKGYDASGIYNLKRAADLADRAIVFYIDNVEKSSRDLIQQRADAQSGAIAFKDDKDFKKANLARYKDILANKASKLPIDKIVEGAIEDLSTQIKDGLAKGEKGRYNDIIIGRNKKGNEVRLRDASNHMSNILDDYNRYVDYVAQAERDKESDYSTGYYEKQYKEYAKSISDKVRKIKQYDYAW